jgi:hypothetical protein
MQSGSEFDTDHQWTDIFTKTLPEDRFVFILRNLNIENCPD